MDDTIQLLSAVATHTGVWRLDTLYVTPGTEAERTDASYQKVRDVGFSYLGDHILSISDSTLTDMEIARILEYYQVAVEAVPIVRARLAPVEAAFAHNPDTEAVITRMYRNATARELALARANPEDPKLARRVAQRVALAVLVTMAVHN